jgi:hypothetical protein
VRGGTNRNRCKGAEGGEEERKRDFRVIRRRV